MGGGIDLVSLDRMSSGQSGTTSEISQIHSHSRSLTQRQIIHTGFQQPDMLTMPSFLSAETETIAPQRISVEY